ncbi:MAG: hypothetical protein HY670_01515 [Chloroflexi bacterium]|nr:hypothetical protein [Chloroflexota bacterium]
MEERGFTKEQLRNFEKWRRQVSKKIEVADVAGPTRMAPRREEEIPRYPPAVWPVPEEDRSANLEKYCRLALSMGAAAAKAIAATDIPQDLRAMYIGCLSPSCRWLNTNFHCPLVRRYPFEDMQEFVSDYKNAIVFKVLPPKIDAVPDVGAVNLDMYYTMGGGEPPDKAMLARNIIRLRILNEMERRLRQVAYYDGYLMAAPIGSGPCIVTKCASKRTCQALKPRGVCWSVEVQPNGQLVYIDYHALGRRLDWGELQPGGNCAFPEDVPDPSRYYNIGVVLID